MCYKLEFVTYRKHVLILCTYRLWYSNPVPTGCTYTFLKAKSLIDSFVIHCKNEQVQSAPTQIVRPLRLVESESLSEPCACPAAALLWQATSAMLSALSSLAIRALRPSPLPRRLNLNLGLGQWQGLQLQVEVGPQACLPVTTSTVTSQWVRLGFRRVTSQSPSVADESATAARADPAWRLESVSPRQTECFSD